MSAHRLALRVALFAGASTLALTVGAAQLRAADMGVPPQPRPVLKAPPPVAPLPVLPIWIEGAAFWTGGGDIRAGCPDFCAVGARVLASGVRVADLRARLHLDAKSYALVRHTACVSGYCATIVVPVAAAVSADERSHFLGIGPRLAAEGSVALGGPWAVDYTGGVAVLFGDRKLDINGTAVSADALFGFGPTPPVA